MILAPFAFFSHTPLSLPLFEIEGQRERERVRERERERERRTPAVHARVLPLAIIMIAIHPRASSLHRSQQG
jgi:hypothetical protein